MPIFDKKLCLNNIYYLAKEQNVKIGDLENNAEISLGYFSRLIKDDNKTSPSIDVLCSVAKDLKISIDSLISVDFQSLTADEKLIVKFIDTLMHTLSLRKDNWEIEKLHLLLNYDDYKIPLKHPLLAKKKQMFTETTKIVYNSMFYPESDTHLIDDVFYTEISYNETLFISHVGTKITEENSGSHEESIGYELYISENKKTSTVCCAYEKWSPTLYELLKKLYSTVKASTSRTVISKDVRSSLNRYIRVNEVDDTES